MRSISAKNTRRLSRRQELKLANATDARQQKGSGALPWAKGDVRKKGKFRAECKFTRARSYILKIETLDKIRSECAFDETPVLDVTFHSKDGRTDEHWVMIPYEDWLKSQKEP